MPPWIAQHESVTIEPPASSWRCRPWPIDGQPGETARTFRRQIGLPIDRPVVMSGHQAAFWHAGIAAKVFALTAAARRFEAASAWVVVDQDLGVPGRVAYPVVRKDKSGTGRLARATVDLLTPEKPDIVTGRQAPGAPQPVEVDPDAAPVVAQAIARMAASLKGQAARSRALQVSAAALGTLGAPSVPLISSLALSRTDFFASLVKQMAADPAACTQAYNAAVARHPEARMRQLATGTKRSHELPLWRITDSGSREPVLAADLGNIDPASLAPKALTMTALLRWAGCDLFIHGLGGGHYDPVMEEWLASWLAVDGLAPAVVVSATRLMPLAEAPPPTPEEVAHARWLAHHARHDPAIAEAARSAPRSPASSSTKRGLAAAVRAAEGPERLRRYRAMHEWLEQERAAKAAAIGDIEARAAELAADSAQSGIVFDRTWPAPLLPDVSLASLRAEIADLIGQGPPRG